MSSVESTLNDVRCSMSLIISGVRERMKTNNLIRTSDVRDRESVNSDIRDLISHNQEVNSNVRSMIKSLSEYDNNGMIRELISDLQSQSDDIIVIQCYAIGTAMYSDRLDVKSEVELINKRMTYLIEYYTRRIYDVGIIIDILTPNTQRSLI